EPENSVNAPPADVREPLHHAEVFVAGLELLPERGDREAPGRIAGEADCDHDEERCAPPFAGELLQGARAVGRLATRTQRELEREKSDHAVEEPGSGHAHPPE